MRLEFRELSVVSDPFTKFFINLAKGVEKLAGQERGGQHVCHSSSVPERKDDHPILLML